MPPATDVPPGTPAEVDVRDTPAEPYDDPTMGIEVEIPALEAAPRNRLVVIGDSVSHGVLSGAVWRTELTWPALVAEVLGIDDFRIPVYGGPGPGLPINLESLVRRVGQRFGPRPSWFEVVPAALLVRHLMDAVEDYWERGPGAQAPPTDGPILHNLASLGFDLRDALTLNDDEIAAQLTKPSDDLLAQVPEQAGLRAARMVLASANAGSRTLTQVQAARALGDQGDQGIDTLVIMLGSNNALRSVSSLKVKWSDERYREPDRKDRYTVWRPSHFAREWEQLVEAVERVKAHRVIVANIPHITIAPIARGVGGKLRTGSRYFTYYTRPWISDEQFDPRRRRDPFITGAQARAVDSAIDQYNRTIADSVRHARAQGQAWYLFDLCSLLDRAAYRRFLTDAAAQPDWFEPYPLPPELLALDPVPDTRFYGADESGRTQGGLFSLDGIHPTTIAQGTIAHEMLDLLRLAGAAGADHTIEFAEVIRRDSLISDPPAAFNASMGILGWLDQALDTVRRIATFGRR